MIKAAELSECVTYPRFYGFNARSFTTPVERTSDELAGVTQQEFYHLIAAGIRIYRFVLRRSYSCRSYYSTASTRMNNLKVIRSLQGQLDL